MMKKRNQKRVFRSLDYKKVKFVFLSATYSISIFLLLAVIGVLFTDTESFLRKFIYFIGFAGFSHSLIFFFIYPGMSAVSDIMKVLHGGMDDEKLKYGKVKNYYPTVLYLSFIIASPFFLSGWRMFHTEKAVLTSAGFFAGSLVLTIGMTALIISKHFEQR